jgi:predicted small secreted protein
MYKRIIVSLAVLMLAAAVPLLSACHTTAGVGEDVSEGGRALEHSANAHAP